MDIITILNIEQYTQQIINGNLLLTKIQQIQNIDNISENKLFTQNLSKSKIIKCKINNEVLDINYYNKLLLYLYYHIDKNTIIQNTTLNISKDKIHDKGFKYYKDLGISIQGAESRKTLREIINVIKLNNFNIELKIKLENNEIINFKL
jgi:hypothetical protein